MAHRRILRYFDRFVISSCIRKNQLLDSTSCCTQPLRFVGSTLPNLKKEEYEVTFIRHSGEKVKLKGKDGDSLLDIIVDHGVDFNGFGACEGTLTCSTCHVILKQEDYDRLPNKPCEEENDMLDLAYGCTETSRLGCQIVLSKELDGLEIQLPESINDARS